MKWWYDLKLLHSVKFLEKGFMFYGKQRAYSLATRNYIQGQEPEPKIREYFYYIDHEGMVSRKNTIICTKI